MSEYYKFLRADMAAPYSNYQWPLDEWVEADGPLKLCRNGIHAALPETVSEWIDSRLFVVELGGETITGGNKACARRGRLVRELADWNETTQRLFAADCAERVLPLFEREHPEDFRPRKAIEAARAFARGEIGDAARDAAGDAAWAAARDAAGDAAWAAAGDAAWAAAGDAAGDAARAAARDAARDAAWAAARAAAGDAAWDAEHRWQSARLLEYAMGGGDE